MNDFIFLVVVIKKECMNVFMFVISMLKFNIRFLSIIPVNSIITIYNIFQKL